MREIEATLEAAIEADINFSTPQTFMGQGDSERTLARLLHRHGDRMFVVTKVGGRHSRYATVLRLAKPLLQVVARSRPNVRSAAVAARTATVVHDFSPRDLLPAVDASRCCLSLDQLHGLLLHSPSVETLGKPEIHDFLAELLRSGKAQRVGASVDSLAALEAAISPCPPRSTPISSHPRSSASARDNISVNCCRRSHDPFRRDSGGWRHDAGRSRDCGCGTGRGCRCDPSGRPRRPPLLFLSVAAMIILRRISKR
jgi:aryl-alcohol dehydrogenase-like predicted oxidoreductase